MNMFPLSSHRPAIGPSALGVVPRIPWIPLVPGMSYTQVSASCRNTVLLRSDGWVVTCGDGGANAIPPLEDGTFYTQATLKKRKVYGGLESGMIVPRYAMISHFLGYVLICLIGDSYFWGIILLPTHAAGFCRKLFCSASAQ